MMIGLAGLRCLMRKLNHHPNGRVVENVDYEASYQYAHLAHRLGL
mgnify:CR=1 FL=1